MPPGLVARARKWYVVQGASSEIAAEVGSDAEPEPIDCPAVVCPYDVDVPHSNESVVARPFGLTLPFSVAPVVVTPVAAPVVTTAAGQPVSNVASAPFVVPAELVAVAR